MSIMEDSVTTTIRVRYSETDQMGTFYNSRVLEWFEVGRTEYLRSKGVPYTEIEHRGVMLPLVETHIEFLSRAVYDDELLLTISAHMKGRARVRFDLLITHTTDECKPVARGNTVHAVTNTDGRPVRTPKWLPDILA